MIKSEDIKIPSYNSYTFFEMGIQPEFDLVRTKVFINSLRLIFIGSKEVADTSHNPRETPHPPKPSFQS